MKKCTSCGNFRPESEFHWRNKILGKRRGYCKACQSDKHCKWYEENIEQVRSNVRNIRRESKRAAREYVQNYIATHSCVDFGETNPVVLEFDHIKGTKTVCLPLSE